MIWNFGDITHIYFSFSKTKKIITIIFIIVIFFILFVTIIVTGAIGASISTVWATDAKHVGVQRVILEPQKGEAATARNISKRRRKHICMLTLCCTKIKARLFLRVI